MKQFGFSEGASRRFIQDQLEKAAPSTSFYWESEELEDVLDLLVDVMSKVVDANNKKITQDWEQELRRISRGGVS